MPVKNPVRRSSKKPLGGDFVKVATRTIAEGFGLSVDFAKLSEAEQHELFGYAKRIDVVERVPAPTGAAAAEVDAFIELATKTSAEQPDPLLKKNALLAAERARLTRLRPSGPEIDRITGNTDPQATLESLRLPEISNVRARGIDMNRLDEKERARFDALVEKGVGAEPGSVFEKRREQQRLRVRLAEQAARLAPGPRKRLRVDEPGTVVVPAEMWTELLENVYLAETITMADLAIFVWISFVFENRKVPDKQRKAGIVKLEDDGTTLCVRCRHLPFGWADQTNVIGSGEWDRSLERLGEKYQKWLTVTREGGATGWVRIRRGPRLTQVLAKRAEVGGGSR